MDSQLAAAQEVAQPGVFMTQTGPASGVITADQADEVASWTRRLLTTPTSPRCSPRSRIPVLVRPARPASSP
ncbi:MAG: hypothetical protein ACLTSX_02905 [Collinsella sp.]